MSAPALQVGQRARLTRTIHESLDPTARSLVLAVRGEPAEVVRPAGGASRLLLVKLLNDPLADLIAVHPDELEPIDADD